MAEDNLGIASRTGTTVVKWLLSDLIATDPFDTEEPYTWNTPAGQEITTDQLNAFRNSAEAKSVLVDISNDNIDWDNLEVLFSIYPPPSLPEIDDQVAPISVAFSFTFDDAIGGNPQYTYSVVGQPPGITLSGLTLSGSPTSSGPFTVTITAHDEFNNTDSQSFSFTVTDTVPVLPELRDRRAQTGVLFSHTLSAAASDSVITYSISGNPAWLTISDRLISGTPATADINETGHVITYTATDADGDSDSEDFILRVGSDADTIPAFDPVDFPVILTGREGDSFSENLPNVTGGNPPITFALTNIPPGLAFSAPIRHLLGTPTQAGTFSCQYSATDIDDINLPNPSSITITVTISDDLVPTLPAIPDQTAIIGNAFSYTLPEATGRRSPPHL